ncbi:MAG: hypothetical protein AB8F74_19125 [Saprospiraceae bacterium]
MKLERLLFFALFLICSNQSQAQLKKGDFYANSSLVMSHDLSIPKTAHPFGQALNLNAYKMVSKRIMLGGEVGLDNGSSQFHYGSGSSILSPHFSYSFSTEVRAYFNTGKWAPYVFLSGRYEKTKYEDDIFHNSDTDQFILRPNSKGEDEFLKTVDLGFGLDFFISPNIVLATRSGWNILQKKNYYSSTEGRQLYLNSSFSLLFKKGRENEKTPLINRYLKMGNILVSGNLNFNTNLSEETKDRYLVLNTKNSLFVSDRTEAIASFGYSFDRNNEQCLIWCGVGESSFDTAEKRSSLSTGLGIRHYFQLRENLFLAPSINIELSSIKEQEYFYERIIETMSFPLALDLVFFKNQSRYFLGSGYHQQTFSDEESRTKSKFRSYQAYLGFDYFFQKSFYLRSQLTTQLYGNHVDWKPELDKVKNSSQRVGLSFTFGFMIGGTQ